MPMAAALQAAERSVAHSTRVCDGQVSNPRLEGFSLALCLLSYHHVESLGGLEPPFLGLQPRSTPCSGSSDAEESNLRPPVYQTGAHTCRARIGYDRRGRGLSPRVYLPVQSPCGLWGAPAARDPKLPRRSVRTEGLEPSTCRPGTCRSVLLSYVRSCAV